MDWFCFSILSTICCHMNEKFIKMMIYCSFDVHTIIIWYKFDINLINIIFKVISYDCFDNDFDDENMWWWEYEKKYNFKNDERK